MATTQPYLEITDGVTSCKIMDVTAITAAQIAAMNYRLSFGHWAPRVSQRNDNPLGLPYLPVMEEMVIDVKGVTADVCYAKLQVLNTLLDQADRWWNNEGVAPVFIKYQPLGSSKASPMQDVIIGGAAYDNAAEMVTLPDDTNYAGVVSFLKGVKLKFYRKNGFWLGEAETQNVGSSYVAQPGPVSVTWSDFATVLSPVDITLGAGNDAAGASTHSTTSGISAFTHDATLLKVYNPNLETSAFGAATADAAHFPTNATVYRFTANPSIGGIFDISSFPVANCEYFAVYVKVRTNTSTTDATIRARTVNIIQQKVPLPQNTQVPRVVFLGIFPTRFRALPSDPTFGGQLYIDFTSLGGSITIDLDSILVVGLNRATTIVASTGFKHPLPSATLGLYFLHRLLAEPLGEVALTNVPNDVLQNTSGAPYVWTGAHGTVKQTSLVHFMVDTNVATYWNIMNTGNTAKITLDLRATRTKAYLTPE